jgi:two-component system response regulator AlgR
LIDDSLRQLEDEFGEQLIRIHRSTLVTRQSIERLETNDHGAVLYLRGLEQGLPVSRRHLPSLRKIMKQL